MAGLQWESFEDELVSLLFAPFRELADPDGLGRRPPRPSVVALYDLRPPAGARLQLPRIAADEHSDGAALPTAWTLYPATSWSLPDLPVDPTRRKMLTDALNVEAHEGRGEVAAVYADVLVRVAARLESTIRRALRLGPDFFTVVLHPDLDVVRRSVGDERYDEAFPCAAREAKRRRLRGAAPLVPDGLRRRWRSMAAVLSQRNRDGEVDALAGEFGVDPDALALLLAEHIHGDVALGRPAVNALLKALDWGIGRQLDSILHHPRLAKLESTWRQVDYLVQAIGGRANVRLELLNADQPTFEADLDRAVELRETALHQHVYAATYAPNEGLPEPYTCVIGLYSMGPEAHEIKRLERLGELGRRAQLVFLMDASRRMFGLGEEYAALDNMWRAVLDHGDALDSFQRDPTLYDDEPYAHWTEFRGSSASRYVALAAVRARVRPPYQTELPCGVTYVESVLGLREGPPWGSTMVLLAAAMVRAFARDSIVVNFIGAHADGGPVPGRPVDHEDARGPWLDAAFQSGLCGQLADQGFVGWQDRLKRGAGFIAATTCATVRMFPNTREGKAAEMNQRLENDLPHHLLCLRFAQYLKVIRLTCHADLHDRATLEDLLHGWLQGSASDQGPYASHPLREARVELELADGADGFPMRLTLSPAFRYMGIHFTLSIDTWVEA